MKVIVTGSSGFIGTNLVKDLVGLGHEVIGVDTELPRAGSPDIRFIRGSILDRDRLAYWFRDVQPDSVVHLGARCDLSGLTVADYPANTIGVENVIAAVQSTRSINRVLFASSRYVHSNEARPKRDDEYSPFTVYGASKVEGERLVRNSSLDCCWTIVRPTSIWGPCFAAPYRNFFDAVRKGRYVHPRGVLLWKSLGFVGNVTYQLGRLLDVPDHCIRAKTLYLSDYEPIEVYAMSCAIARTFAVRLPLQVSEAALRLLARCGDLLKVVGVPDPPLTSFRLRNLMASMIYDVSDTCEVVGPLPYSMEQGIAQTVEWMLRAERSGG
jgi:nucleoside-diphosphate-sugar epimerase